MTSSTYYAILTDAGAALEATALATGVPVSLTQFVIGDGGGAAVVPDPSRTKMVNEVYRGPITGAVAANNQVTFTLDVPTTAGGYTIREAGILTSDGTLYSLSNSPDILKPTSASGAVISITFKYVLAVSSTSTVTVTIYSDYLTPDAADARYLQITKNLSEIKANGATAQQTARTNLGLGDIATKDDGDYLAKANNLSEIKAAGTGAQQTARTNLGLGDMSTKDDGDYLAKANYLSEIKAAGATAQKTARQNINAVASVNSATPDANGNVTLNVGGIKDVQLGAEVYVNRNDDTGIHRGPTGYVLTALHSNYNDSNWEVDHIYAAPIQKTTDGTTWVTVYAVI